MVAVKNEKKEVRKISQRKIVLSKTTRAYELLSLVALFGEFPTSLLPRISGGDSYKETIITDLKQKGLIKTHYADGLRGLRPSTRIKRLLLSDNPDRFAFCLSENSDTNHVRSEPHRRERLYRIAEASVTMMNSGVSIFRDERPAIFSPKWRGGECIRAPAFYSSREIKELGVLFSKIKGARSAGVLLTEDNIFVTYSLGDSLLKWRYRAEMRNKALLQNVLCLERLPNQYSSECICGIILANTMELAYSILSNKVDQYLILDDNFEHFYFATNDKRGEMQIKLLCRPDICEELDEILTQDLYDSYAGMLIENDAMTEQGEPVLLAYKCDLKRIKKFDTALSTQNKSGIIYCFDYQADVLRRFCSERVTFRTLDYEKTERRFFS